MDTRKPKRLPKELKMMFGGGASLFKIAVALMTAIWELARELGKTDDEAVAAIHRLSKPEGKLMLKKMAEAVFGSATATAVVVRRSFADLLAACQQKSVSPDFTEARWPLESVVADEDGWEVAERFFDDNADGSEKICRLAELEREGEIRMLIGVRRAMEFVASHLDTQLDHPLVAPLSARGSDGSLCLPAFSCNWPDGFGERELVLRNVKGWFSSRCGWLVLRKKKA